jgi:hypothetical protein
VALMASNWSMADMTGAISCAYNTGALQIGGAFNTPMHLTRK